MRGNAPVNASIAIGDTNERENLVSQISDKASFQHTKYGNLEAKHDLCDDNVSDDEVQIVTKIKINVSKYMSFKVIIRMFFHLLI